MKLLGTLWQPSKCEEAKIHQLHFFYFTTFSIPLLIWAFLPEMPQSPEVVLIHPLGN